MVMTTVEDLKNRPQISREDIENLLATIGKPGEKQEEKIEAVKSLGRTNRQGFNISETLHSYSGF